MENSLKDAELERYVRYFESAEQATSDSREEAEKARDYYDGKQWTDAEVAALKKRKQPVITVNRIKPKINSLKGIEAQRRTLPKAYPRTQKHEDDANAASDALRFVIEDQNFDVTRSKGFENLCIEGVAGVDIPVRHVNGEYKIHIDYVMWDRLFYDPHSRMPNFSDAKYLGQVIWMDFEDAIAQFPEGEQALSDTLSGESSVYETYGDAPRIRWADPKRKRVRIVEMWHKDGETWQHCIFTKGGILESMQSPYADEENYSIHGMVLGSAFIDRDGNRYGVVKDWIPIQDEINKRRSKAQHLLSVRQVITEKGAVEDINKARQELAKPDGVIEVVPNMKFEIAPTGDMAAAQFNLLQEAKNEIDAVGVNAALSGTDERQMSGRAQAMRQESGLNELGPLFDAVKQWQLDIYRAVWFRIRQFWTEEKWIRVTDDEKNVRFVGLNKPVTLGEQLLEEVQAQGREVTPEMQTQAQMDPMMQQVVSIKNPVAELDVDITLDEVPASASLQTEQFQMITELAKSGMQFPPKVIIKASQLRNKEELLKEMGADGPPPQVMQMQQQMQQMSQQMAEMHKALMDKAAEREIKSREVGVKEYAAETDRLTTTAPAMAPEQIQAIVVQTIQDLFTNGAPPAAMPPQPMPMQEQMPMQGMQPGAMPA